jgi:N-acetylglucosamine kinase-like BadF-type ATPase
MSAYYLGVDTGATKSEALIAGEAGQILGYGRSGPGNWESAGWEGARAVLGEIINHAAQEAGITLDQISASGLGLAGYDWPEDHQPHEAILRETGLSGPLFLVNDALLGLFAAAEAGVGVVVSAGTSCNCYGRDVSGRIGRLTGSSFFGEYAGAGELVHYALRAVARAWSLRGPQTALSDAFVRAAGADDVDDLLAGLMRGRYALDARHAAVVFETAVAGDTVARRTVDWAGRELGDLALGVIRQLDLAESRFDLVLSGSFFKGSPRLRVLIEDVVSSAAPGARFVRLNAPPVAGGVLLAMASDLEVDAQIQQKVCVASARIRPGSVS